MFVTPYLVIADYLLDPKVKILMSVFSDAGLKDEFRFVGGCVRNTLMNLPIADVDIATTLVPEEVKMLFEAAGFNVHPTGIEHGTVTVSIKGEPFEITTCRRDVETDGRRAVIAFTKDWAEDAERRDFRCNSLYMDMDGRIYDYAAHPGGGIQDCHDRNLVFVGDADARIREDYLRILRLFRFMATLGAKADWDARAACAGLVGGLQNISGERIEKEMMKLLAAPSAKRALEMMEETGVYGAVFVNNSPEWSTIATLFTECRDPEIRLASLCGIPEFADLLFLRWKSSTDLKKRVRKACGGRVPYLEKDRPTLVTEALRSGMQAVRDRMILSWAGGGGLTSYADVLALADDIAATLPVFPLKGQDILDLGVAPGRAVGELLKTMEVWWTENGYPDRDATRDRLIEIVVGEPA